MDYNFTISAYDAGTTYSKHSIVYVLTGSLRTYYYSLIDNYLMSYRTINEKYKDNESIITEDGKKNAN